MWFVVGLGNPGRKYAGTRHNVGFEVVEALADRHRFGPFKNFKNAEVSRGDIAGQDTLLIQPMTYMNLSGDAVGAIVRYYKGDIGRLVVVHDELDFEPGELKVKNGGGHGGHNGLRSIMGHLGRDFARVRMGVGKPPKGRGADHVLSGFDAYSRRLIDDVVDQSCDAVETILDKGIQTAMNRFNQKPSAPAADTV